MPERTRAQRHAFLRFCLLYYPGAAFTVWGILRAVARAHLAYVPFAVGIALIAWSIVDASRRPAGEPGDRDV